MNVTILGLGWISGIWQICLISGHSARLSGWIFDYLDEKLTLKIFTISNFFFSLYFIWKRTAHEKSPFFVNIAVPEKFNYFEYPVSGHHQLSDWISGSGNSFAGLSGIRLKIHIRPSPKQYTSLLIKMKKKLLIFYFVCMSIIKYFVHICFI